MRSSVAGKDPRNDSTCLGSSAVGQGRRRSVPASAPRTCWDMRPLGRVAERVSRPTVPLPESGRGQGLGTRTIPATPRVTANRTARPPAPANRPLLGRGGPASAPRAPWAIRCSEAVVRPHHDAVPACSAVVDMTGHGVLLETGGRTTGSATPPARDWVALPNQVRPYPACAVAGGPLPSLTRPSPPRPGIRQPPASGPGNVCRDRRACPRFHSSCRGGVRGGERQRRIGPFMTPCRSATPCRSVAIPSPFRTRDNRIWRVFPGSVRS
jgi:hypothetical protein